MVISDPRDTECSDLTDVTWALQTCYHEKQYAILVITTMALWHGMCKCMSCHKATVVITGRTQCFSRLHVCYAHRASMRLEHSVCRGSLMTTLLRSLISLVSTFWFIVISHM